MAILINSPGLVTTGTEEADGNPLHYRRFYR